MKKGIFLIFCLLLFLLPSAGCGGGGESASSQKPPREPTPTEGSVTGVKLRMSFKGHELVVSLYDSPASRELAAMLPLALSFSDFAETEKIAYLPQRLSGGTPSSAPPSGDFTYYSPWGNLALFYRGVGQAGDLYILGKIDSGKESLAQMDGDFTATLERISQ